MGNPLERLLDVEGDHKEGSASCAVLGHRRVDGGCDVRGAPKAQEACLGRVQRAVRVSVVHGRAADGCRHEFDEKLDQTDLPGPFQRGATLP